MDTHNQEPPLKPIETVSPSLVSFLYLFYQELFIISLGILYTWFFFNNRKVNKRIITEWSRQVTNLFEYQFAQLGDKGQFLHEQTPSEFYFYATGRRNIHFLSGKIKLANRQDLFIHLWNSITTSSDELTLLIELDPLEIKPFIFGLVPKSETKSFPKSRHDFGFFTKAYTHSNFRKYVIFSEHPLLMERLAELFNKKYWSTFDGLLKHLVISDQSDVKPTTVKTFPFSLEVTFKYSDSFALQSVEILRSLLDFIDELKFMSSSVTEEVFLRLSKNRQTLYQQIEASIQKEKMEQVKKEKKKRELGKLENLPASARRRYEEREEKKSSRKKKSKFVIK